MRKQLVWIGLFCVLFCDFLGLPPVLSAAATVSDRYDLTGDGSALLTIEAVDSHVLLKLGDVVAYDGSGNGLSYYQTLVLDFDSDGTKEIVVVENRQPVVPHQAFYKLFALRNGTLRLLSTNTFSWSASLRNLSVGSLGLQGKQLLGISRTSAVDGLSWIDNYWLLGMQNDQLQLMRQVNQPDHLIHLQVTEGQLLEKYALMEAGLSSPSSLRKQWLRWDGSAFIVSKEEQAGHYYLEESDVPQLMERVAKEQGVPLEILQAVAEQESATKQFDYGDYLVSPDGGIGIMQVTPQNGQVTIGCLGVTYSGDDLDRLGWDTYFNLQVGAQVLQDKWLLSFGTAAVLPRVGEAERGWLESWYFALWAYNGYSQQNFPQAEWGEAYQEQVIDRLPGWTRTAAFTQPSILNWNGAATLPAGGKVFPYTGSAVATLPGFGSGDRLVTTVAANLRADAAIYPTRLGILGAGSQLTIEASSTGGWLQVLVLQDSDGLLTGQRGFVKQEYVSEMAGQTTVKERVNLRKQPVAPSDEVHQNVLSSLPAGTSVQIVSGPTYNSYDGRLWYAVQADGSTGYLAVGSLREETDPTALFCTLRPPVAGPDGWEISGNSKPGSSVQLYVQGKISDRVTVGGDAEFHFLLPPAAEQVTVQVEATDQRGQQVVWSEQQTCALAGQSKQITTRIGAESYSAGYVLRPFDSQTVFRAGNGVTVMAMHLFRELGATVTYDRGLITLRYGSITAVLSQGESTMQVTDQNGTRTVQLRAPIVSRNSRTFIPTRDVSENLGLQVAWDPTDDSITISSR